MGLSLPEAAKLAANQGLDYKAGVIETFAGESDFFGALPMMDVRGSAYAYTIESAMASTAFRAIGGTYTASTGTVETRTEALKIAGGEINVDRAIIKMNGPEARTRHVMMKTKALARALSYQLIEGSSIGDPTQFDGLKNRVITTGSQGLALASTAALSMKNLDLLKLKVDNPTHWLMSKEQAANIWAYLRTVGSARMEVDAFGRELMTYAGLPILIYNKNGDYSFTTYGEASSTDSLFCLSLGMDGVHGIQAGPMDVVDLGENQASPSYTTRIEWLMSIVIEHPRAIARGYSFTNATAVA